MITKLLGFRSDLASERSGSGQYKALTNVLSLFVFIAATVLAFAEYFSYREDQRVEASLRMLEKYNESHLAEARYIVFEPWHRIETRELLRAAAELGQYSAFISKIIETEIQESSINFTGSLHSIIDFFDSVDACIQSEVCDDDFLYENVGPYATRFYCLYRNPYIADIRRTLGVGDEGFATGLERFVRGQQAFVSKNVSEGAQGMAADELCGLEDMG